MAHDFETWITDKVQDIVLIACEKIVQAYYFIALVQEPFAEMRAKEASSAGDQYSFIVNF